MFFLNNLHILLGTTKYKTFITIKKSLVFHIKYKIFKSGFTIIELIIVITIISIIAGLAVPRLTTILPDYKLQKAAGEIISCMQTIKLRAVKENANVIVIFDLDNDKYTAFVDNGAGNGIGGNKIKDGNEDIVMEDAMPSGINLYKFLPSNSSAFGFNSQGLPATSIGSVFIKNNKSNYRRIILNIAGNIRVKKSINGKTWN